MQQLLRIDSANVKKYYILSGAFVLLGVASISTQLLFQKNAEFSFNYVLGIAYIVIGILWAFTAKYQKSKKRFCFEFTESGLRYWKAKQPNKTTSVGFDEITDQKEDESFLRFSTSTEDEISIRKDLIPESIFNKIKAAENS